MRDDLQRAIYSGARSITHDGKTVQYGSLREMLQALSRLESQIRGTPAKTIQYLQLSSGDRQTGPHSSQWSDDDPCR